MHIQFYTWLLLHAICFEGLLCTAFYANVLRIANVDMN